MKPRRGLLCPRFIDEDTEAQGLSYLTRVTQAGLNPKSSKSQSSWRAGSLASATDMGGKGVFSWATALRGSLAFSQTWVIHARVVECSGQESGPLSSWAGSASDSCDPSPPGASTPFLL